MSRNELLMHVPPERVYDVLSDPRAYARWVVGSRKIRAADAAWPAPGTAFDHAVGLGPLVIKDNSEVLQSDRPRRLRLLVKLRPVSQAYVTMTLEPHPQGTRVVMEESAADARTKLLFNRMTDPLLHLRNAESLKRLKRLAEGEEPIPEGDLPPRESPREASVTGSSKPASS